MTQPTPITIRVDDTDRATLETAAKEAGQGMSTFMRGIAEREAQRIRTERIRGQLAQVAAAIEADPELRAEVELLSGDGEDWPEWTGPLPG